MSIVHTILREGALIPYIIYFPLFAKQREGANFLSGFCFPLFAKQRGGLRG
jgi:hypothetical protein